MSEGAELKIKYCKKSIEESYKKGGFVPMVVISVNEKAETQFSSILDLPDEMMNVVSAAVIDAIKKRKHNRGPVIHETET